LEAFSRADTLANTKEALHLLNKHLNKVENQDVIPLSKENRQTLTNFGLEKEEMEAIEARTFRPLDAHHLQTCFLLRDVARTLDQQSSDPLEEARLGLAWVDRQVLLREGVGDLLPPLFALQAGQGNTRERALVFLALLQQFRLPACVLLWPASEGKQERLLLGVLIARGKHKDIFLFDPRLGRPVPGPGADGILTLAQLRKDPTLIPKNKNTSQPEIFVAVSLSALSPRMKYLEDQLARSDRVVLAVEPTQMIEQMKAAAGAVKVWDLSLRVLPAFLPPAEGGTNKTGRLALFEGKRVPMLPVAHYFAALKLLGEDMPVKQAQINLLNFSQLLFSKYAQEPHDQLLKGQLEKAIKRLQILRAVFDDLEFSPPADFSNRVNLWRNAIIRGQWAMLNKVPGAKEKVGELWARDQYLAVLLQGESPDPQKHPKEELSYIILTAVQNSLGEQILYLLALALQEKAERHQATWEHLKNVPKAGIRLNRSAEKTREAWGNVCGWWKKYEEMHSLAWSSLEARFRAIEVRWHRGNQQEALSLWELYVSQIHRAAAARLFLARAYQNLGQSKEAVSSLTKLDEDLTALLDNADIQKELSAALDRVRAQGNPIQTAILESLSRDLGPEGGFSCLREKARAQLEQLKAGK
jgi:hypothetical protein